MTVHDLTSVFPFDVVQLFGCAVGQTDAVHRGWRRQIDLADLHVGFTMKLRKN
jgi:hypothetical protein